jgi:hypothetical protein
VFLQLESGTIAVDAFLEKSDGYGVSPFTYEVVETSSAGSVITQVGVTNEFTITGLGSVAGITQHQFRATITDGNGTKSSRNFTISIEKVTVSAVPVVTGPSTIEAFTGQFVNAQIVATNGPITSWGAAVLPSGLSVNASTGKITGSVAVAGTYNISLVATNSFGVSAAFPCSVIITDQSTSAPALTSSIVYVADPITGAVAYQITYSGTAPVTVSVTNLPAGWYFNSSNNTVYGTSAGTESFTVNLSNAYGNQSTTIYNSLL